MTDPVRLSFEGLLEQLPSPESKRAYASDWARYMMWLELEGVKPTEAKPRHVAAHIAQLRKEGKAKATIARALSVLRETYSAFVRDELMDANPAREVKNVKMSADPRAPVLTEDEVRKLLDLPAETWRDRRNSVCLHLLFGLGLRRAEVARLRYGDFHSAQTVSCTAKGGKRLVVGVPGWLWLLVMDWVAFAGISEENEAILPRSEIELDQPISGASVWRIVVEAAQRAGLKASPHALRRTNITLSGERGVSLKARQLAVGHTSQATTERYDKARDATKNAPGEVFADFVKRKENKE